MSLHILAAHTGEQHTANPSSFSSLDAFKAWLSREVAIPASHQIILTSSGRQAKFQSLSTEDELFLYNRQVISAPSNSSTNTIALIPKPPNPSLQPPPDTLTNQNDLSAWQDLFKSRRSWALESLEKAKVQAREVFRHCDAFDVIERGVGVAVGNLEAHVRSLEQHYSEARSWSDQEIQQQGELLQALDETQRSLKFLPAHGQFLRFLPILEEDQQPTRRQDPSKSTYLDSFINAQKVHDAAGAVRSSVKSLTKSIGDLGNNVNGMFANVRKLFDVVDKSRSDTSSNIAKDAAQLLEEIEVVARKVCSDYEETLNFHSGPRTVAQASKMALQHTRSFLPSLREYSSEMNDLLRQAIDQRNQAAAHAIKHMQLVAANEASFARVDQQVKALDFAIEDPIAFQLVELASQLPFIYGALLIEAVRRREWTEKIRGESASLAEDIAGYREEEERRRKRWIKDIGHTIREDAVTGRALNFELSIQAEEFEWPEVHREDVEQYLSALKKLSGLTEIFQELNSIFKDLDTPTKRQIKTARNFKSGSVHEMNTGKTSFLLRDHDEMKTLREANVKLEDDVKGQKSRVRKLEDLLYRQSQAGRSASGNIFQTSDPSTMEKNVSRGYSPSAITPDGTQRRGSATFRRASSNKSGEEKVLARRIVDLEAQLIAEKQRQEELTSDVNNKQISREQIHAELEESRSTKNDLMANLEAQQREFSSERRLLEENLQKEKNRAEEAEEELERLERVLESHDAENLNVDEKLRTLESHLDQKQQVITNLKADVKRREETQEEQEQSLRAMHNNLDPGVEVPSSIAELINSLDELVERSARHAKDLELAVAAAKSEGEGLQTMLDRKERDFSNVQEQIEAREGEVTNARNESATEKARATSLAEELEDGRQQLKNLRAKFAEGETGSESLRQRVEEQASRASKLATELAESKSHVNSLDVELTSLQRRHHELVTSSNTMSSTLEKRTIRGRELTTRLVAYHQELARLLECLGLSVTRRDGAMVIQRSSKLASQSTTLTEPGGIQTSASITALPAGMQPFDTTIDTSLLSWSQSDSPLNESEKFTTILSKIDDFNLTTFAEAVIKLRRDVEWTGKKWKMEARNYRDKHHRSTGDAHDKIAFRAFKEGDLALFLPTRNQATRPWAAFNVGAPHYFLREHDTHRLQNREWLVARISKIEERVVNLSRGMGNSSVKGDLGSATSESGTSIAAEDDNPFALSDGLHWYLLDAVEEKSGAPTTPGLGKSTVASAHVDAKGSSIGIKKLSAGDNASGKLNKSLESRRSSSNSKRGSISSLTGVKDGTIDTNARPTSRSSASAGPGPTPGVDIKTHMHTNSGGSAAEQAFDEHTKPAASPPASRGLLGLFGSPQRSWLHRGQPSHLRNVSRSPSPSRSPQRGSLQVPSTEGQTSLAVPTSAGQTSLPPPGPTNNQAKSSGPVTSLKQLPTPFPGATSQIQPKPQQPQQPQFPSATAAAAGNSKSGSPSKPPSSNAGNSSNAKSPNRGRRPQPPPSQSSTAWESLWSLDVNFEEGKGRKP